MKKTILFLSVIAIVGAGCQSGGSGSNSPGTKATVAGLTTFSTCEALGDFLESKTGSKSAPGGTPTTGEPSDTNESAGGTTGGTGTGSGEGDAAPTSAPAATVEEADIVKQEGNRLYVAASFGKLFIYDVTDAAHPYRLGEVSPGVYTQEMFVFGTKVVLIGQSYGGVTPYGDDAIGSALAADDPYYYEPSTHVSVYDAANGAAPVLAKAFDFKGNYIDSRKVGGAVYLALQRWIEDGPVPIETQLKDRAPCDQVYVPEDIDGNYHSFPAWEIAGIDLSDLSKDPNKLSVVGSWGSTVTATPDHFYLTNYFYETGETGIFLFDLDPATAGIAPRAKASVPGFIVNQFSMDETAGVFRIASTTQPTWFWAVEDAVDAPPPPAPPPNKNYLTTFRASDGSLARLGQLDTIVPGEQITAARFLGDRAFVTTFVYTDPLVSIDVSDPANPKIDGELHIPGATNYLQAWGEDRLVAIGSGDGWSSVILNLFDVSDPAHPALIEQETIPDSYGSEAQFEHLAFSFFEDRSVLAIPVYTATGSEMAVYSVDRDTGFTRLGGVNHDDLVTGSDYSPTMRRSLEIGGLLYTVSEAGLKVDGFSALTADLFEEMFPGFTPPVYYGCGCVGDVCSSCPETTM
ncbi:MAG TPA: beta-propeller domain-containing protein [bacterium]|nr:beta-propeller domain-containing protein [bacterium]